jgi:hypothetical protein
MAVGTAGVFHGPGQAVLVMEQSQYLVQLQLHAHWQQQDRDEAGVDALTREAQAGLVGQNRDWKRREQQAVQRRGLKLRQQRGGGKMDLVQQRQWH